MSHTFSATIEVPHPPSEVWKTLCDTDHWEQWATFRVVKRGPLAVGEPVTIGFRAMGLPLRGAARFIEVRPEQALWWRGGLAPLLRVEHGFSLTPHGGGTRLVHEEHLLFRTEPTDVLLDHVALEHELESLEVAENGLREGPYRLWAQIRFDVLAQAALLAGWIRGG